MTEQEQAAEEFVGKSDGLTAALVAAQKKMKNAGMNKVNPHFKSKYADLASIREAVMPHLLEHGIALVQEIQVRGHGTVVVTKLMRGRETIASECPVMVGERCKPQEFGSALTYARRYGMAAICGIASDEDDDANAAQGAGETDAPKKIEAADWVAKEFRNNDGTVSATKVKQWETDFYKDLHACSDMDSYTALVSTSKPGINVLQTYFPGRWHGDGGDVIGLKKTMAQVVEQLKPQQAAE